MLRRRMMIQSGGGHNLPSEYQEVKFLESTGTQYINLGFAPYQDQPKILKLDFLTFRESNNAGLFGFNANSGEFLLGSGTCWFFSRRYSPSPYLIVLGKRQYIEIHYTYNYVHVDVDGERFITGEGTNLTHTTFLLFAGYDRAAVRTSIQKWYNFSVLNFDTKSLEKDLYPCYRKSDGVAGMYDIVNDVFYTNQGTGEFIVGPNK